MYPGLNPNAVDCVLGRLFANCKRLDITVRDLAKSFGASHMTYLRASNKINGHVRALEQLTAGCLEESLFAMGW